MPGPDSSNQHGVGSGATTPQGESASASGKLGRLGVFGAGSAVAGGAFSFVLFDQLHIGELLRDQSSYAATVYALTAFCMIALIIMGTGLFAVSGIREKEGPARLFYMIAGAFGLVFLAGFGLFWAKALVTPTVTIKVAYDRFDQDIAAFDDPAAPKIRLKAYFRGNRRVDFQGDANPQVTVTDGGELVFGLDNLTDLERKYASTFGEMTSVKRRNAEELSWICNQPDRKHDLACMSVTHTGMDASDN